MYIILEFIFHQICEKKSLPPFFLRTADCCFVARGFASSRRFGTIFTKSSHTPNPCLLPYYGNNFMEIIWWNYLMQIIWLNCFVKSLDWIIQWNHLMESFHNIKASEYYRRSTIWSEKFFHCVTFSDKQIGTIIVWLNAGKQNCGFCICYIVFKAVGSSWLSCIFFNQSQLMMFDKHENMGKFLKNVSCMSRDFRRSWINLILTLTENETGLTFFSNS